MFCRNRKGFTLIELLVVIAIIAILAAILFPVFIQIRQKAKAANCTSNLKQWGMAMQTYASDFRSCIPPGWTAGFPTYWSYIIYPYVKNQNMWFCPSGKRWEITRANMYESPGLYWISYGLTVYTDMSYKPYPRNVGGYRQPWAKGSLNMDDPANLDTVTSASRKILMGDTTHPSYPLYGTSYFYPYRTADLSVSKRHSNGSNVLFVDGHCGWYHRDYLTNPTNLKKLYDFYSP